MGRRTILVDDYDGKELPDGTKPVHLALGRTTYTLHLSEANHGKLLEVLHPFIDGAETLALSQTVISNMKSSAPSSSGNRDKMKAVRSWAQSTGYKYKNTQGKKVTLGDRGRIPDEVVKAYEKANA